MKTTLLEGTYKGLKVLIRVTDPKTFLDESPDSIGFVHCCMPNGEMKSIQVRRGDIWGIKTAG